MPTLLAAVLVARMALLQVPVTPLTLEAEL